MFSEDGDFNLVTPSFFVVFLVFFVVVLFFCFFVSLLLFCSVSCAREPFRCEFKHGEGGHSQSP